VGGGYRGKSAKHSPGGKKARGRFRPFHRPKRGKITKRGVGRGGLAGIEGKITNNGTLIRVQKTVKSSEELKDLEAGVLEPDGPINEL